MNNSNFKFINLRYLRIVTWFTINDVIFVRKMTFVKTLTANKRFIMKRICCLAFIRAGVTISNEIFKMCIFLVAVCLSSALTSAQNTSIDFALC